MIFRFVITVAIVPLLTLPVLSGECESGCQTTVVVTDCEGNAVANAKVQIKLCCGEEGERNSSTNGSGEATFDYCLKDICGSKVVLEGFAMRSFDRSGCSENGKRNRCEIKVCTR